MEVIVFGIGPNLAPCTEITQVIAERMDSTNDYWSYQKSATFFASVPVLGLFQLTVWDP